MQKRSVLPYSFFSLLVMLLTATVLSAQTAKPAATLDADLAKYPAFYQQRIKKFRNLIRAQKTREAKVQKALSLAANPRSPYRKDAIRFLTEVKAAESVPSLIAIGRKSPEVRDEIVVAMNHFQSKEAIDYLIECLLDPDPTGNIRSMSILGLKQMTNQDFEYRHDDSLPQRQASYSKWRDWWQGNRETFVRSQVSREDQEDANESWQKYGLPYLSK